MSQRITNSVDGLEMEQLSFKTFISALFRLEAQPNPFTTETQIVLDLHKDQDIQIRLVDAKGSQILAQGSHLNAGTHMLRLSGDLFPAPGIYYCHVQIEGTVKNFNLVKI